MQRPDEAKRRLILDTATRLFATRPFHEVRLDDVAAAAGLGKGTLYIYFASKEALYLALIREGFAEMVEHALRESSAAGCAWQRLRSIVRGLIAFGSKYPDLYRVMRSGMLTPEDPQLLQTRAKLNEIIQGALETGIRAGEIEDPHPDITAQFIPAFVRGALLFPAANLTPAMLEGHIMRVLQRGVSRKASS